MTRPTLPLAPPSEAHHFHRFISRLAELIVLANHGAEEAARGRDVSRDWDAVYRTLFELVAMCPPGAEGAPPEAKDNQHPEGLGPAT